MSRELWKQKDELPSGTLFYGGIDRGMCIQLTTDEESGEHFGHYITFSVKIIRKLIRKLEEVKVENYN